MIFSELWLKNEIKTNKISIKELRTKIKNQKNNDWSWNIKNKKGKLYFLRKKREEKEKE
jgi:uncharacterized protein YacL (UPF0231 family)